MRKLRWLEKSVQKVTVHVSEAGAHLVRDFVVGVVISGSTVLSRVARALKSDKKGFEAALERLSRGLRDQSWEVGQVLADYRRRAVAIARSSRLDVVAIDLSEIVKPYGRKMPWLCEVRDASKSNRHKTVIEKGWWTVEVVATGFEHQVLPLVRHVYSTVMRDFRSVQGELRRALDLVKPLLWKGVRAVLDRGFDGENFFEVLDDYFAEWAIRQRGDRQVFLPGSHEPMRMSTLAKSIRKDLVARPTHVRDAERVRLRVATGHCTVEVPTAACRKYRKKPRCRLMTLVVAERYNPDDQLPMMLLTRRPMLSDAEACQWVVDYYRRWGAEDETRGAKQLGGLEDVRVLSWESLCSVVALSVLVDGLLALLQFEAPRRAARLARLAPLDGDVPPYALHRLWISIALLLAGRTLRA